MMFKKSGSVVCAVLAWALVAGLGCYSVLALNPPRALPKDAPPGQFSAHRAIEHAFACSMESHPAGSKNNDRVAEYFLNELKKLGIEAEFMSKSAVHGNTVQLQQAVIGRIPGTDSTGAIAFSAHYDSVPYGPGATDDISGCVAMLETARAFMNRPRMRNDLLFIFADAEEIGGYGARGFCSHPLAEDIGIISELDVRGLEGPALVYETSSGNGALIAELRKAKAHGALPVSNSLMFAIYEASPFGSDFTKFRNAGMKGYSLAFIDNFMW
ncbi:MAG: M20/M25/M40 family metallo-hydrolase, partial [bacterium]|nr:M20/M25/M40 family metallo-hydrolase [bacterium]